MCVCVWWMVFVFCVVFVCVNSMMCVFVYMYV